MNLLIPVDTWICLALIIGAFSFCFLLVYLYKDGEKLVENRRIVEYFPTLVSTLGVLGTFWGITKGLMAFDAADLDKSIPNLLDGLKTAFFTSLAGMLGSMVLSAFISRKQDEKYGGISDINQAALEITKSVKEMSEVNSESIRSIQQQIAEQEADRKAFYRTAGNVMSKMSDAQIGIASSVDSLAILQRSQENSLVEIKETMIDTLSEIKETTLAMLVSLGNIEDVTDKQHTCISYLTKSSQMISASMPPLVKILDALSDISALRDGFNNKMDRLIDVANVIHNDSVGMDSRIAEVNSFIEIKLDEFAELLKKNRTDVLVELMKSVADAFNEQMSFMLSELVQKNFEKLNESVENLNQWQQENKWMIESLTIQYKEMSDNFNATSTSLARVKDDTASLVGSGGKLRQLVDSLNKIIVEDEYFFEVTKELRETANLSKSSMAAFCESTRSLNEWMRNQRNFADRVQLLIAKLDELNNIRDYGEQFWKETKDKMEEGIGIISRGSQTLNTQLTSLDRQFYSRLSATLAELDNCITKMVEQVDKRN